MAPPPARRPGQNRKAQYGLFVSYVIAIGGALIGAFLLVISIMDPSGFAMLRVVGAEVTRPISTALRTIVRSVDNIDDQVSAYIRAGSQNAALRQEVEANRTKIIEAAALKQENVRLKRLLALVERDDSTIASGRLISSSPSSPRRLARLNVGSSSGIRPGMPVRAAEGLIGRVVETSPNTATVLLLTDETNIVPVKRTSDSVAGIASGLNDGTIELRGINVGRNSFAPGDVFVTSGTGGLYQSNIPVAIVVRAERDRAIAVPLANPSRVEVVIVQRPLQEAATPAQVPPSPATP